VPLTPTTSPGCRKETFAAARLLFAEKEVALPAHLR
jgi:hypothetical protein